MSDFADVRQIEQREVIDARTKRFEGTGTEFLIVPGLKKVEAVTVGSTPLPLSEVRRYLEDTTGRETPPIERPLVSLQQTEDGRQVLLRSKLSNDGKWQQGVAIYVTGEWEGQEGQKKTDGEDQNGITDFGTLKPAVVKALQKAFDNDVEAVASASDDELLAVRGVKADDLPEIRRIFVVE